MIKNLFDKMSRETIDFDYDIQEIISEEFWDLMKNSEPAMECPHEWMKRNNGGY